MAEGTKGVVRRLRTTGSGRTDRPLLGVLTGLLLVVALLVGSAPADAAADPSAPDVLLPLDGARAADAASDDPQITRSRSVAVDLNALSEASTVTLRPFDDITLTATRSGVQALDDGASVWSGRLAGTTAGTVQIVVRDGLATGEIRSPDGLFQIRPVGSAGQVVVELDPARFPDDPESDGLALEPVAGADAAPEAAADSGDVVDLLVLYTADARAGAGGTAAMESIVDLAVAQTNQSLTSASVPTQVRLVHRAEVAYTETGSVEADLIALRQPADGVLDQIHGLRDQHGADLVALIVDHSTDGYCGIGYILGPFSVSRRDCATGNATMAHELGHNLGARHDWFVDATPGANKGFIDNTVGFRTLMAYRNGCTTTCGRVLLFSNPRVTVNGAPAGVPVGTLQGCTTGQTDPGCDADNAASIAANLPTVANWRQAVTASPTTVAGTVRADDGSPVAGVKVNLFTDGRARFLGLAVTDGQGGYGYTLADPGCHVVTFIAPGDAVWSTTGGRYRNARFCAAAGEAVTGVDATLVTTSSGVVLTGSVTDGSGPVAGVKAVLYEANADGSRGRWLRPALTDASGDYRFDATEGCFVIDLVAPDGRTWQATGGRFRQVRACAAGGETVGGLGGTLG